MPVYPGRRAGTWRVTVFAAGRQKEWIVGTPEQPATKKEARDFEAAKRLELKKGTGTVAGQRTELTFSTFCVEHYKPHAQMHLGKNTYEHVRKFQLASWCEALGDTKLSALGPGIEKYKRASINRGIKPSTINHDLRTLKTMLRWGVKQGLLDKVPEYELLKTAKRRVRAWTREDVARLYRAIPDWLGPMLHFMLDTGCRKGEVVAARWDWVDWKRGLLTIPVTETWHPKDRDERDVPLSAGLTGLLAARWMAFGDGDRSAPIFPSRYGKAYAEFPDLQFREAVKSAGLAGGPHMTRHTFASHFLVARPDLRLLADVLGHGTTYVTELYAHMLPEHLEKARGAVELKP